MQKSNLKVVHAGGEEEEIERMRSRSAQRATLEKEIATLRVALAQVTKSMKAGEEDAARLGSVTAKLSDSIVRALVAQQKLSSQDEGFTWLRAQFDRMLRELGYGERT